MKRIIFLEGLPGVGKTTLLNYIKDNYEYVNIVPEIVNVKIHDNINTDDQSIYTLNDELKINMYDDGIIIIDRGPISTLSYNETKKCINENYDDSYVFNWFNSIKDIYNDSVIYYLKKKDNSYFLRYNDNTDPYGSIDNLKKLEDITLKNIKRYSKNYKIIEYDYKNMEVIINEIIS